MRAKKRNRCLWCRRHWSPGDRIDQTGALILHYYCMKAYKTALRAVKEQV